MRAVIGTDLLYARQLLEDGKLVAIPTETVYGLAGNAFNNDAVAEIYKVKNRPEFNPLIVHVGSLAAARELVSEFPPAAMRLAQVFWPGPLTLILPKKDIVPDLVTAGSKLVALRVPGHEFTLSFLQTLNFPLASPSANPFGYVSPTTAQHVADQLGEKIDYILDGGDCQVGLESTIVQIAGPEKVIVRRLGGISVEDIEHTTGFKVEVATSEEGKPIAAGMLEHHYSPNKPVFIGRSIEDLPAEYQGKSIGFLRFQFPIEGHSIERQFILSPAGRLEEAAKQLFTALRLLDGTDFDAILAEPAPDISLGRGINDRLKRAAAK